MTPGNRVLLRRLSERTNPEGRRYLVGRLGDARVLVLQAGETDRYGNPVWEVFASAPGSGPDRRPRATARSVAAWANGAAALCARAALVPAPLHYPGQVATF